MLLLFALSEFVLRKVFHIYPGEKFYSEYFTRVDTLIIKHGFEADSTGIMKVERLAAETINNRLQHYIQQGGKTVEIADSESVEVYNLAEQYLDFHNSDFRGALKDLTLSKYFPSTQLDSAIAFYLLHPINDEGFRSIPFKQYNQAKKKVLLLGDSFTWGHSASNMLYSFSDNLLAKGYAVYNTGITCTDPVQYQLVAEKYVSLLKPDFVVMNVYLGNDVQYYTRKPIPYFPQMIPTNAGNLMTDFNGVEVTSVDSVYQIIADNVRIPSEKSWFNKFCSFTSFGTLLWRVLTKLNLADPYSDRFANVWRKGETLKLAKPDVNNRVRVIQKLCDENTATLLVCVIPYINQAKMFIGPRHFNGLFDSIPHFLSPVARDGYENRHDGHFNNIGHKEYSEFLDHLIDSVSKVKR